MNKYEDPNYNQPPMREVVLHGELARKFGKHHRFSCSSAAQAVRALSVNFKGFERHLRDSEKRGVAYNVWVNGKNIGEDRLRMHSGGKIYISPVVMGSKRAGLLQAILGAVLIVVGAFLIYTPAGVPLIAAGASLLIGGITQMLAPVPKQDDSKQLESAYFDGPVQTTAQGGCVPVGYGRAIVGAATISAGISIEDDSKPPGLISGSGGGGGGRWGGGSTPPHIEVR